MQMNVSIDSWVLVASVLCVRVGVQSSPEDAAPVIILVWVLVC